MERTGDEGVKGEGGIENDSHSLILSKYCPYAWYQNAMLYQYDISKVPENHMLKIIKRDQGSSLKIVILWLNL